MLKNIALNGVAWASSRWSLSRRVDDDCGQDLVEYSVLIGAIALVLVTALFTFGPAAGGFDWFKYKIQGCFQFQDWSCGG